MAEKILLASASPRRRQLMEYLQIPFTAVSVDADETMPEDCIPSEAVVMIAARKARAAKELPEAAGSTIVAADTIVVLDGEIFGKPSDEAEACAMLRRLSGREHTVYTGVCMFTSDGRSMTFCDASEVIFYPLSDRQIKEYVASGEPMDKAGAYGIQGAGALLVEGVRGNFYNVMGLPIARLSRELKRLWGEEM